MLDWEPRTASGSRKPCDFDLGQDLPSVKGAPVTNVNILCMRFHARPPLHSFVNATAE